MARQVLYLHWKASRLVLIPFVLAAFGLPLLAIQGTAAGATALDADPWRALRIVEGMELWLPLFPALAGAVGITLALTAWHWDHQAGHVYALSLPVARWRYALLKMGAGAALVLVPAAALLAGSLVAAASLELPAGLHAYPFALTLRFLAAALVVYGIFFSMAAGTVRTTVWVLTAWVTFLLVGTVAVDALATAGVVPSSFSLMGLVGDALFEWPGPFHVLDGNWRLIDV